MMQIEKMASSVCVMFRYDDYSARSNTVLEQKLFSLFEEEGIPLTVGVIPLVASDYDDVGGIDIEEISSDKMDILLRYERSGVVDIALHGHGQD